MHKTAGFTLMELLIVTTIIGILVAIAIPSYQTYTRRAHYTEVVQDATPYKLGVEECYQIANDLKNCNAGSYGVPPDLPTRSGPSLIGSIDVQNGVITVTPQTKFGITPKDNYILRPTARNGKLMWISSGGGVSAGYAN